jgi:spermidine synthase
VRREAWLAGLLLAACAGALGAASHHPGRTVHQERSLYLNINVNQTQDSRCMTFGGRGNRQSCIDLHAPRSLMLPYTRALFAAFFATPAPRRVLMIGLGGGMVPRTMRELDPDARIDVVELDPAVLRVAERYFDFRQDARMRVHVDDGRVFVRKQRRLGTRYDLVMIDAFDKNYIPEHMLTREFMAEVRDLLAPGGIVAANTFSRGALQRYEIATYQSVYGPILAVDPGDGSSNRILLAGRDGMPPIATLHRNAAALAERLTPYGIDADQLMQRIHAPPPVRDARPLTDQYSPANLLLTY